jgi:hypothetical protein
MRRLIAATIVALLATGVATTATAGANPRIAYGYFTNDDGRWAYSNSSLTPEVVAQRLIDSGAEYIKAGKEAPPVRRMRPYYHEMRTAGLQLGVRLNSRPPRSISQILDRARFLADSGWFQWVFLDGAQKRPHVGRLVDRLKAPVGGDWDKVASNDTGWHPGRHLARGEWFHSRHLGLFSERRRKVASYIRHGRRLVTKDDLAFVHAVRRKDRGSVPVLKFEVHTQTDRLSSLSSRLQRRALRELSGEARRRHFTLIWPLFVAGLRDEPGKTVTCQPLCGNYDSIAERTYGTQQRLLGQG